MKNSRLVVSLMLWGAVFGKVYGQDPGGSYSWANLPKVEEPVFRSDTVDIRDFGANGNGRRSNGDPINKAIEQCHKRGGGVVLIPDGYWISGPIVLQSNVNLHLAENAFLQFTDDFSAYDIVEGNYEGKPSARNQSPISGKDLTNIAITGRGTIDGNGDAWRMVSKRALTADEWKKKVASGGLLNAEENLWYPSEKTKLAHEQRRSVLLEEGKDLASYQDIKDYLRPNLVLLVNCERVLLQGVTFQNSPAWNIHPLMSRHLTVRDVKIKNPDYAQNGDGIDIESCADVLLEDCILDVGDDAICIKSGKDEPGRLRGIPTERVIVRRNKVYLGHGGFVIGSEMSGGARDIFVEDCTFMGTDKGIRFKSTRGRGGIVENIHIRNINMANIVQEAIFFDMYYWTDPPKANEKQIVPQVSIQTPRIRKVFVENIRCNGAEIAVFMRGLPEMPLEDIHMRNLSIRSNQGFQIKDAKAISAELVDLQFQKGSAVYIESAQQINFTQMSNNRIESIQVEVHGENCEEIQFLKSDITKQDIHFANGAKQTAVQLQ